MLLLLWKRRTTVFSGKGLVREDIYLNYQSLEISLMYFISPIFTSGMCMFLLLLLFSSFIFQWGCIQHGFNYLEAWWLPVSVSCVV